jgi:voltage-gated potassium channel Kch
MGVLVSLAGLAVVLAALDDMFRALLYPRGSGMISRAVMRGIWTVSRASGHRFGSAVGPLGMVAVVVLWAVLLGAGWALIYAPHVPQGFSYSSGIAPEQGGRSVESVYIAYMTLSTLGLGDVVPAAPWLRLVTTLEALTGFALITTAMTWFLQIYPPLSRRRSLGLRLATLGDAELAEAVETLDASYVATVLDALTAQLTNVQVDLEQHSESYFFHEDSPRRSLARQLPIALALRDAATASPAPELRLSGRALAAALDQLAAALRRLVRQGEGTDEVFRAYAAAHERRPRR